MDNLSSKQRSYCMSHIQAKDTKPEKIVRSIVHRMGYRYSLHKKKLPGHPDIVLSCHRKIIFVHGCFWHMHKCRFGKVVPKTNNKYWQTKRQGNVERDKKNIKELKKLGWKVLIIWECQAREPEKLSKRIREFLKS